LNKLLYVGQSNPIHKLFAAYYIEQPKAPVAEFLRAAIKPYFDRISVTSRPEEIIEVTAEPLGKVADVNIPASTGRPKKGKLPEKAWCRSGESWAAPVQYYPDHSISDRSGEYNAILVSNKTRRIAIPVPWSQAIICTEDSISGLRNAIFDGEFFILRFKFDWQGRPMEKVSYRLPKSVKLSRQMRKSTYIEQPSELSPGSIQVVEFEPNDYRSNADGSGTIRVGQKWRVLLPN